MKCAVIAQVAPHLPAGTHFIPAHPVAGTENSGPEAGFATLFINRWCILTPQQSASHVKVNGVRKFWEAMGANVEVMTAEHHDLVLAITSHVPHLIAYNIVGTAADLEAVTRSEVIKFSAGGFRDFTRIAASDPTMWRDVFLHNKEAVLEIARALQRGICRSLARAIRWGDGDALFNLFTRTRAIRRGIIDMGQETAAPDFGRPHPDPDEPGTKTGGNQGSDGSVERLEQDRQRHRPERHLAVADAQWRQRQQPGLAVVALPALGQRVETFGQQAAERLAAPAEAGRLAADDLVEAGRRGIDQADRTARRIDGETPLRLESLAALDHGQEHEIDDTVAGAPALQLLGAAAAPQRVALREGGLQLDIGGRGIAGEPIERRDDGALEPADEIVGVFVLALRIGSHMHGEQIAGRGNLLAVAFIEAQHRRLGAQRRLAAVAQRIADAHVEGRPVEAGGLVGVERRAA